MQRHIGILQLVVRWLQFLLLLLLGVLLLGAPQLLSLFTQPVLSSEHATAIVPTAFSFGEVVTLLLVGAAVPVRLANAAPARIECLLVKRRC